MRVIKVQRVVLVKRVMLAMDLQ